MCGVYSFISSQSKESELQQDTDSMYQRGPDSGGCYFNFPFGLEHRRLSIIDLNTNNQPMVSEDKRKLIVFHREIFNYSSVKKEQQELNYVFHDTQRTVQILNPT